MKPARTPKEAVDKRAKLERCLRPGFAAEPRGAGQPLPSESLLTALQERLKEYGTLYDWLVVCCSTVLSSRRYRAAVKTLLRTFGEDSVVLNLGSGPPHFVGRSDFINVDVSSYNTVDLVADAASLPMLNACADLAVLEAVLEHVPDPVKVVAECRRVLKPGGRLFIFVPFMQPGHQAPSDYYRWNSAGVEKLLDGWTIEDRGVGAGPTSGVLWMLTEWLALVLSCGWKKLHDLWILVLTPLFAPLKCLDLVLERLPQAEIAASGFYAVARK